MTTDIISSRRSGQFDQLDVMLPLATVQAKVAVVAHVSGEYLTNAPWYRERFWEDFEAKGGIIERYENMPLAQGEGIKRCAWLYFFQNKAAHTKHYRI